MSARVTWRAILLATLLAMSAGVCAQEAEPTAPEPTEAPDGGEAEVGEEDEDAPDPDAMAREMEEVDFRVSLPTAEDFALWAEPGFRLQFGYGFTWIEGPAPIPDSRAHAIVVRAGARLEEDWSLMGTLSYAFTEGSDLCGLRFIGTIEPTWHPTPELAIAIGWGIGGFVELDSPRRDPEPELRDSIVAPYTMTDPDQVIPICTGLGTVGSLRIDYLFIFGNLFSTGPSLEGSMMWTGCEEDLDRVSPDTAEPIVRRQWWRHATVSLGWMFAWR